MEDFSLIIPVAIAIVIALVVSLAYLFAGIKEKNSSPTSDAAFKSLMVTLESCSKLAHKHGREAKSIKDESLLEAVESAVAMLEVITSTTKKVRNSDNDLYRIRSLQMVSQKCLLRLEKLSPAIEKVRAGKPVPASILKSLTMPKGCYFCSRPFDLITFKIVKVKLEKKKAEQYACPTCRKQLQNKKKLRVLHFMNEGKPTHWSETPNYKPESHYYSLNGDFSEHKKPVLALVYSEKSDNNNGSKT